MQYNDVITNPTWPTNADMKIGISEINIFAVTTTNCPIWVQFYTETQITIIM